MKIKSFGSSSAGNAYLLDDGASVLLIECGFTFKNLTRMIREAEYSVSQLAGVLISHEHSDHAECWDKLVDYGLKVYASDGTIGELAKQNAEYARLMIPLAPEIGQDVSAPVTIGSYDVMAFRTFHDAAEPIGFLLRSRYGQPQISFPRRYENDVGGQLLGSVGKSGQPCSRIRRETNSEHTHGARYPVRISAGAGPDILPGDLSDAPVRSQQQRVHLLSQGKGFRPGTCGCLHLPKGRAQETEVMIWHWKRPCE